MRAENTRAPAGFEEGTLYFVGNATTLIKYGGFTVLTDPAFLHAGEHVHLGHGAYTRRLVEPACQVAELPEMDFIVLSHHHGDHFDEVAARDLDKGTPIVTNDHAVDLLSQQGFRHGLALDTWDSTVFTKGEHYVRITSVPAKHAPDHVAGLLPPVMGSVLDFGSSQRCWFRIYISGDTLVHDRLYDIRERFPGIDLALVHAGGTTLLGTLVTMDGSQAVRAVEIVDARTAVPIHYNDFSVFHSGLEDIQAAAVRSNSATKFHYVTHGDTYRFHPLGVERSVLA